MKARITLPDALHEASGNRSISAGINPICSSVRPMRTVRLLQQTDLI